MFPSSRARRYRHFFKRFFDILLSACALLVLSPVLLIVAGEDVLPYPFPGGDEVPSGEDRLEVHGLPDGPAACFVACAADCGCSGLAEVGKPCCFLPGAAWKE